MKKVFVFSIPLLAIISLIGSGYSAWSFGGNGSSGSDSSATVNVTDVYGNDEFGKLEIIDNKNTLSLHLEQNYSNKRGDKDVYFDGYLGIKFTYPTSLDVSKISYTYEFSLDFVFNNSKLFDYVNFTFNNEDVKEKGSKQDNGTFTYSYTTSVLYNSSTKSDLEAKAIYFDNSIVESKVNRLVPSYINKPTTESAYNKMVEDIFGNNNTSLSSSLFSITASFKATPITD